MTENNKFYSMRVIPLVIEKESDDNRDSSIYVDNLLNEEINNMSSEQRMLWHIGDQIYLAEKPLTYRGNEIRKKLYYVFDELTSEEQEKYFDRSIIINVTRDYVVTVYDDNSKRLFPKKKIKKKEEKSK